MVKKTEKNLIVGLDIGTSKVVAIVGEINPGNEIEIIGLGSCRSRGLKKGVVVNIESTVHSIQRAIEAGDEETGVCIMQMDAGLDTGPVLLRQTERIAPDDTGATLHDRLAGTERVGQLLRAPVVRHERAGAVAQLDHAFVLQLAVRLGHGVRVDHQLLGQRADPRQLLARAQRAGFDAVLHLLHDLEVDGHAGRRVGPEQHGTVLLR